MRDLPGQKYRRPQKRQVVKRKMFPKTEVVFMTPHPRAFVAAELGKNLTSDSPFFKHFKHWLWFKILLSQGFQTDYHRRSCHPTYHASLLFTRSQFQTESPGTRPREAKRKKPSTPRLNASDFLSKAQKKQPHNPQNLPKICSMYLQKYTSALLSALLFVRKLHLLHKKLLPLHSTPNLTGR